MKRTILAIAVAFVASGCFRTTYSHLAPPTGTVAKPDAPAPARVEKPGSWQHFFLWGWVPSEKKIDAAAICGGAGHVVEIHTEESFLNGLVRQLASYYVNVYSPYTGKVVCDGQPAK